jgi:oxygen-dependent protoporphyrinogen oxidase
MRPARVIGAGLSGLVAAWHLAERGFPVTVFEQAAEPGGLIRTRQTPDGIVETAANAFVWDDTVASWFQRLGLHPEFPLPSSRRRFIFRKGRPRRWPLSPAESMGLVARVSAAALTRSTSARGAESLSEWGHRVIGDAATRWLLAPATQGIYGAPPDELSARAIFGGRRRGKRRLAAPPQGMKQFVDGLYARLRDRGVRFEFNTPVDSVDDRCPTIVCTNAPAAARLIAPHASGLSHAVAAVRVAPLVTVTMFFEPHPADLRGFGILFPADAGVHALGVLHNSDIFAGRSADRSETWIVGDRGIGMTTWPDDRLRAALADDRRLVTGREALPKSVYITRWPQAIPVYDAAILALKNGQPSLPPWLSLTGNYLGRIGVAALLEQAEAAATRVR